VESTQTTTVTQTPTTVATTALTNTVTALGTVTEPVYTYRTTVPAVTSTETGCPIVQIAGPSAGQYLYIDYNGYDLLDWQYFRRSPGFYLDAQNRLSARGNLALVEGSENNVVYLAGDFFELGDNGLEALVCSIAVDNSISCVPDGDQNADSVFAQQNNQPAALWFNTPDAASADDETVITIAFDC
jgi:hypothetical protein